MGRSTRSSIGGAANTAGDAFRTDVATRLAAHILAQKPVSELSAHAVPIRLSLESGDFVDDVRVATDAGATFYMQAKRTVGLDASAAKPLPSAFDQFIRQYIDGRMVVETDRLVLAYSKASASVALMAAMFRRLQVGPVSRSEIARSKDEKGTLARLEQIVSRAWRAITGGAPAWDDLQALFKLISFWHLPETADGRVDPDPTRLMSACVPEGEHGAAISDVLRTFMVTLAKERRAADLRLLQATLRDRGIQVQTIGARAQAIEDHLRHLQHQWNTTRPLGVIANQLEWTSSVRRKDVFVAPRFEREHSELTPDGVVDDLRRGRSVAVVGPVGSGKSTFLAWCAAKLAETHSDGADPIPLRVHARDVQAMPWNKLVESQVSNAKHLGTRMRWHVLVDGVDEVGSDAWSALGALRKQAPIASMLAVSRTSCSPSIDDGFQQVSVAAWTDVDVEMFLRRWDQADTSAVATVRKQLGGSRAIELLRNPLAATSALLIARDGNTLPRSRTGLVAGLSHLLFDQWRLQRPESTLRWNDVAQGLTDLALFEVSGAEVTSDHLRRVFAKLGYPAVLQARDEVERHLGVLVRSDVGKFSFVLRAIAEYLVGERLRASPPEELLRAAHSPWAREPVRHAISAAYDAGDLEFAERALFDLSSVADRALIDPHSLHAVLSAIDAAADLSLQAANLSERLVDAMSTSIAKLLLDETSVWVGDEVATSTRRIAEAGGPLWDALLRKLLPALGTSRPEPSAWYACRSLTVEEWRRLLLHRDVAVRSVAVDQLAAHISREDVRTDLLFAIHDQAHDFEGLPPSARAGLAWRKVPRDARTERAVALLRRLVEQSGQQPPGSAAMALLPGEANARDVVRALMWFSSAYNVPPEIIEDLRNHDEYVRAFDELWPTWQQKLDEARPHNPRPSDDNPVPPPTGFVRYRVARACGTALARLDPEALSIVSNRAWSVVASELIAAGDVEKAVEQRLDSVPLDSQLQLGALLLRSPAARTRLLEMWPQSKETLYPGISLEPLIEAGDIEAAQVYSEWLPRSPYNWGLILRSPSGNVVTHPIVLPVARALTDDAIRRVHTRASDGTWLSPIAAAAVVRNMAPAWQEDGDRVERVWTLADVDRGLERIRAPDTSSGLRGLLCATRGIPLSDERVADLLERVHRCLDATCPADAHRIEGIRLMYVGTFLDFIDERGLVDRVDGVVRRLSRLAHRVRWSALAVLWPRLSKVERDLASTEVAAESASHEASSLPVEYLRRFVVYDPNTWANAFVESIERGEVLDTSIAVTALPLLPRQQQLAVAASLAKATVFELPWTARDSARDCARPADMARHVLFELTGRLASIDHGQRVDISPDAP